VRWLYKIRLRTRSLFFRQAAEVDLRDELRNHIQFHTDELISRGINPEVARLTALSEFGGMEQVKEECRDTRNVGIVENVLQDLRFGIHMLSRSPGFTLLAVLCLTLAIGANAAVFSWIEGVLFRPYPGVGAQDRLMMLAGTERGTAGFQELSWPDLLDYQRNAKLVDAVIGEKLTGAVLAVGDRAETAIGSMVSANYFDAMGIRLYMGRGFEPGEDQGRNAHPVVVISYQLWKDRFRSDPNIVGKTQVFNALPFTIVGVTAPGFYGTFVGYAFQFWVPASMQERFDAGGYKLEDRGAKWLEPFVTLRPGVSAAQAQAELSSIAGRLERDYPETNRGRGVRILPLRQAPFNNAGALLPTLGISLAIVVFVLLIACANVGNLLLVRSFARRQELTMRMALGAGRGRLMQQLLTEGLILSGISAVCGLLVAQWSRGLLVSIIPPRGFPMRIEGALDWRVVALSTGVCIMSTLLFGLVPALDASRIDVAGSLKTEASAVLGVRRNRLRSGLVVLQVSLTFLLLVGAGLLVKSVQRIRNSPPGFETNGVILASVNLFASGYHLPRAQDFQDRFMDRLQSLPGVQSAAYARIAPFSFRAYSDAPVAIDGYQAPPGQQPNVLYDEISPGYFGTVGIPVMSGRDFTRADDARSAPVVIVNEAMVAQFWGGENPVGRRMKVKDTWRTVVGVAKQAKYGNPMENDKPFFYVPLRQAPTVQPSVLIRTSYGPETMMPVLAREVHAIDPGLAVYALTTMREQVDVQTAPQHIALMLLTVFGGMALLLATIGLYGVLSCAVSQNRRELGLRMALGATPSRLLQLVISKGMRMIAVGVVIGTVAALASTRLLGYLLYQISPRDPVSFLTALAVMLMAGLVASVLPAWRATHTDPLKALKS
jgi:predicted permease